MPTHANLACQGTSSSLGKSHWPETALGLHRFLMIFASCFYHIFPHDFSAALPYVFTLHFLLRSCADGRHTTPVNWFGGSAFDVFLVLKTVLEMGALYFQKRLESMDMFLWGFLCGIPRTRIFKYETGLMTWMIWGTPSI